MRSFTPKMIGVMAEALSVYGRVIRRNLGVLLGLFGNLLSLTFGALAIVRTVSAANQECAAWSDEDPAPGGLLARWGRLGFEGADKAMTSTSFCGVLDQGLGGGDWGTT